MACSRRAFSSSRFPSRKRRASLACSRYVSPVHGGDAGSRAPVELELHAGPAPLAVDIDIAVPELEEPVDQFSRAIGRGGREEGPEIEGTILPHLAGDEGLGKRIFPCQFHIRIALVILQQDIEGREVFLDEIVFQHQGFQLRLADDELQIPDAPHQAPRLGIQVLVLEVALDPVAQDLRLPDVQEISFLVPVEIHPGPDGQIPQLPPQGGAAVQIGAPGDHAPSLCGNASGSSLPHASRERQIHEQFLHPPVACSGHPWQDEGLSRGDKPSGPVPPSGWYVQCQAGIET